MSAIEELYKDLEKYNTFDVDSYAEKFLDTVSKIIKHKDPSSIRVLLNYFDDKTDCGFVIQGMIAGIESYPDEVYVKTILHEIMNGIEKYPEWLTTIIYGILNHPNCREIFKENMNLAQKESLLTLFNILEQESPHHRNLIAELRNELENNKTPL